MESLEEEVQLVVELGSNDATILQKVKLLLDDHQAGVENEIQQK